MAGNATPTFETIGSRSCRYIMSERDTRKKRNYGILDVLVIVVIVSALFSGIGMVALDWFGRAPDPSGVDDTTVNILAIFSAIVLAVWAFCGGLCSPLWRWLPPFCFVRNDLILRGLLVTVLVLGTVIGVILSISF